MNVDREGIDGTVFINEKLVSIIDIEYIVDNYKSLNYVNTYKEVA